MKIALRADGGPSIGLGHLIRSASLAEVAIDRGTTIICVTTTPDIASDIFPDAVEIVNLPSRSDPAPMVEWITEAEPDAVFTDAYPVDTAYQQALQSWVPLAVMCDDNRHAIAADLFVNGNLYGAELNYRVAGSEPDWLVGPEYVLLRKRVRQIARNPLPFRPTAERLLVTMGGGDVGGTTPTLVHAFDGLDVHLDVVVGPSFDNEEEVRTAVEAITTPTTVHIDPPNFVHLMACADIAVSACGSTVYELLALGTPFVAVVQADNQRHIGEALKARDLAAVFDGTTDLTAIRDAVKTRLSDPEYRRERRERGRATVGLRGPERVFEAIRRIVDDR